MKHPEINMTGTTHEEVFEKFPQTEGDQMMHEVMFKLATLMTSEPDDGDIAHPAYMKGVLSMIALTSSSQKEMDSKIDSKAALIRTILDLASGHQGLQNFAKTATYIFTQGDKGVLKEVDEQKRKLRRS